MGNNGSSEKNPCDTGGNQLCSKIESALMCVSDGTNFQCACRSGYQASGRNAESTCKDIDECSTGKHECQTKIKDSVCKNTLGSYTCECDNYRTLNGNTCEDKNECTENRGGCGDFSNCINQIGAQVKCECWQGYTGNNGKPGADCKDVDECTTGNPCGSNAKCINTPGSYRCECSSGYTMNSSKECEAVNQCESGKHTCDPYYADCIPKEGSYECRCKENFSGTGKKGGCTPMSGHENLACELVDKKCTAYEDCALDGVGTYSCSEKGRFSQLAAFFSEGGSSDTPLWIWITVGVGGFLLILVLWGLIRHFLKKRSRDADAEALQQHDPYGYGYGAVEQQY
ncbi:calcium binding egf domain-containing protein [Cystoisospora suis]|uniref:Calcium binding egf domain-containing protein n=1 Tax=Cystoisospora suis TaxID=483139 RepID=A0A2C6LE34_9APIC|nr:calcium binding egf domain-containing protein [Cystoisospora suis]